MDSLQKETCVQKLLRQNGLSVDKVSYKKKTQSKIDLNNSKELLSCLTFQMFEKKFAFRQFFFYYGKDEFLTMIFSFNV